MAKDSRAYVLIMEQYKIANKSGREEDAKALLKLARKMAREGKVSTEDFEIAAYL